MGWHKNCARGDWGPWPRSVSVLYSHRKNTLAAVCTFDGSTDPLISFKAREMYPNCSFPELAPNYGTMLPVPECSQLTPPQGWILGGGYILYKIWNIFFARFAREVIFFTKPQNFLPRFAREVIFFTKSSIFSRASRGEVIFFTKSAAKIDRFWTFFGPFPP